MPEGCQNSDSVPHSVLAPFTLYLPQLFRGPGWEDDMLRDARDLLAAVGYGSAADPRLRLGVGLDVGQAYVGNVGSGEVKDFTALGDVVNTAAASSRRRAPARS